MCSQRVTLTLELRALRVECPRCHHRETGAVFVDSETPVAVLLVDAGRADPATIALPSGGLRDQGESDAPEERTHLLLEAESVLDDDPRRPRPEPPLRAAGAKSRVLEDERTRLLLDPVDLKEEPEPSPARRAAPAVSAPGRWLGVGRTLDDVFHGHWRLALALIALTCGVLPPILDGVSEDSASVSLVASFILIAALGSYALAWLSRPQLGWDAGFAARRLQAAGARLQRDLSELRHSPTYLRLLLAGHVAALGGMAGLTLSSILSLLRALLDHHDAASLFRLLCGLLALAGAVLLKLAERTAPAAAPGPEDFSESVAAAGHLPPIVDLNEPLPASFIGGYTTFHKALVVMAQWRGDPGPDEGSCRAALERHLQRHLSGSRIDSERWLGARRSDGVIQLLVDGMILIEVRRGFDAQDAEQALTRMRRLAQRWADKPMILCVFDAPRAELFESAASAGLVALHEAAPFVAARMPTRR